MRVNGRHGIEDAPNGLVTVQELLNTAAPATETVVDLLARTEDAEAWLGRPVSDAELASLRELRGALRDLLHGQGEPLEGAVQVRVDAAGNASAGGDSLLATVLAEILLAQARGDWQRLKLCAFEPCDLAFYDLSKNRSARWCSARCANRVNLPRSRARRSTVQA